MKIIRRLVFFILALIVAINIGPAYADSSPPQLPHLFYGTLKIAGLPASAGAIVEARGTGVNTGISGNPISTNATGVYSNLIVQGSITPGALLRFYVNSKEANQTAVYQPGGISQLDLTVAAASTQTRLSSSLNPSLYGQGVTLTAAVTASLPGFGTPAGQVTFMDSETTLGAVTLNGSGQAVFSTPALAAGSHLVSVRYGGNGAFQPSSGNLTQVVYQPAVIPGQAWAWGSNEYGQLGNGTTSGSYIPVQISLNGTDAIAAGAYHSLAVIDGQAWAWGDNDYGQLGNGTRKDSNVPIAVSGLNGVTAVAAGAFHSLALKSDGTLWGWGENTFGELGNGANACSYLPVPVSGLSSITAIAAGTYHSLALKSDGTVWAWGQNDYGQLATGNFTGSNLPVQVSGLSGVTAIAAGAFHSLALRSDGTVCAWGGNGRGQLGTVTTSHSSNIPLQVGGLNNATAVAAGEGHSLALKSDGTVWAWGYNEYGQLGNGTYNYNSHAPVQVSGLNGVIAIASGRNHSLAYRSGGELWTWGSNCMGQLGNGTNVNSNIPIPVSQINGVVAMVGGNSHTLALRNDGTVWAWGYNYEGQLGNGSPSGVANPVHLTNLNGVLSMAAGHMHSLALMSDGMVWACGYNNYGQLGNGSNSSSTVPQPVVGLSGIIAVAAGEIHSLALKSDGTVWGWGANYRGQLGRGQYDNNQNLPVSVSGLTSVKAISAGAMHSLALKSDGTVWAWGLNEHGQLGNGTNDDSNIPLPVSGLANIIAIATNGYHSLALKSDGTVWAWGHNDCGQLGTGNIIDSRIPVQVNGLAQVIAVAAGSLHSLALKSDGSVWAWGMNAWGEVGVNNGGLSPYIKTPVQVTALSSVTAIAAGESHSLALKLDGTVWAWGRNSFGELGNRTYVDSYKPSQVQGLSGVTAIEAGGYHSLAIRSTTTLSTSTMLQAYPNPSIVGQKVALSALVDAVPPSGGKPTGYVTFKDGQTVMGNCMLDGTGDAFFYTYPLSAGSHTLTAVYSGDENFPGSVSPSVIQVVYSLEEYPPCVHTTSPGSETNGISLNTTVILNFSKPMDLASVQSAFRLSPSLSGNLSVSGNYSWNKDGTTMTFNPLSELSLRTTYTMSLTTSAKDIYGVHLAQDFSSSFTTLGARVTFKVGLEGSQRPESGWNVPLTVRLFTPGAAAPVDVLTANPVYSFSLNATKSSDTANVQVSGFRSGVYDISAASPHCLTNVKRNVSVTDYTRSIDLGVLLEGDANDDNIINIQDFGLLASTYGRQAEKSGFDARADFDRSGNVNIADFGLLAANYHKSGPVEIPFPDILSIGAPAAVKTGENLDVYFNIGRVTDFCAYQFDLSYDASVIEVMGEEGGGGVSSGLIGTMVIPVDLWAFQPVGFPGKIRVVGRLPFPDIVTSQGYLAVIHFKVVGPAGGSSNLTLSNALWVDLEANVMRLATKNGIINVIGE